MQGGYLYIITNKSWPNWIKVGSTIDLNKRLHVYQTCSPNRDYILVYSIFHPKYKEAEKKVKSLMKPFAKSIKNEWFEVDLEMAKPRLEEALEEYKNSLTFDINSDNVSSI